MICVFDEEIVIFMENTRNQKLFHTYDIIVLFGNQICVIEWWNNVLVQWNKLLTHLRRGRPVSLAFQRLSKLSKK